MATQAKVDTELEKALFSDDPEYNPGGAVGGIEGITSPNGRILGIMTHPERIGKDLCINVPGNKDVPIFESCVAYFK